MPGLLAQRLADFQLTTSDDDLKRELEVVCLVCGAVVCDAEDGDTLDLLARVDASHHDDTCPGEPA